MGDDEALKDLRREIQRKKKEVNRLKRENRHLEKQRRNIEKEIENVEDRNKNLEDRNKSLKEKLKDVEKKKGELEKTNRMLEKQIARLIGSAPLLAASDRTAEAGGIPSSKVYYRRNRQEGEKRPTGGQPGHPGHARKKPVPNAPPVQVYPTPCLNCDNPICLKTIKGAEQKRTITDIPMPMYLVYEVVYHRGWCPKDKKMVRGEIPWIPPNQQFGPLVASWIAFQRILGMSIEKVQFNLLETYGIEMSEAVVLKLEKWVADSLKNDYERIGKEILKAKALGGDETKLRVNGMNGWMWVFTSVMAVYYKIAPTRGRTVPEEVLKGYTGGLTRDAWKPYDVVESAVHQLDLLHVNRWLERVELKHRIEPRSLLTSKPASLVGPGRPPEESLRFVDGIRAVLKEAVEFSKQEPSPTMDERRKAYNQYRKTMKSFLSRSWTDDDAVRISKELYRRLDMLFSFVKNPSIPWHNNDAERAIRQGVLHRKLSGGRRTWKGAGVLETLLSISETAKKRGIKVVEWLQSAVNVKSRPLPTF